MRTRGGLSQAWHRLRAWLRLLSQRAIAQQGYHRETDPRKSLELWVKLQVNVVPGGFILCGLFWQTAPGETSLSAETFLLCCWPAASQGLQGTKMNGYLHSAERSKGPEVQAGTTHPGTAHREVFLSPDQELEDQESPPGSYKTALSLHSV